MGWFTAEMVRKTLENTTQLAKMKNKLSMRSYIKSKFPQLKQRRLHETFATDTMFTSVKSFGGYNATEVFSGRKSGMKKYMG